MSYLQSISKRFDYFIQHPQFTIIFLGVVVRLPLLFTPLSFGTDSWRQTDTASIAYHFYVNGYKLFYPQIFWGGNGPGYVETEFQFQPFLTSILYHFFGEHYGLGKLVSLVFSVFTWLLFYSFARKILGETKSTTWALFFFVFSPLSLRYSVAFMPEATVLFFYVATLYFFVDWIQTSRKYFLFLAATCSAMAILAKPTSVHIGLVFALLAIDKWGTNILTRWETWLSTAIALTPGILFYLHARNIYLTYGNTFGLMSGGDSKFGTIWSKLSPHLYYHIPYLDLKWILGFGAIGFFLAGVAIAIKRKELRVVIFGLVTVGIYYLIVSRYSHEEWGIQYHVYMLPYAALTVGLGATWMLEKYQKNIRAGLVLLSVGIFLSATLFLFARMLSTSVDSLYECASVVRDVVPANKLIVVSTKSRAFYDGIPNNYQEPNIFFYSKRYGWSLPADWHTPEKLTEYRNFGAAYFVIYEKTLLHNNPAFVDYLDNNSAQIGPGVESGCGIYRFLAPIH
jgi:hypothetical protein